MTQHQSIFDWMKMKPFFSAILLTIHAGLMAQHSTMRFSDEPINLNNQSLLLIPFEGKMYSSDINKDLAEANKLSSEQILTRFISAIDQSILYTFQEKCNVSSFYLLDDEEAETDLNYVFENRRLEYELVSSTVEKTKLEKFKGKLKKKEDNSYQRGGMQNGEIVTKRDERERYMKAIIKDQKMLDSLQLKFQNKFFLFVNQLDIRNDYSDLIAVQQGNYDRIVQIHYTLYLKNGEILSTGISKTSFPSTENNIDNIIQNHFPILAKNIFTDLFPTEELKKESKSRIKPWK